MLPRGSTRSAQHLTRPTSIYPASSAPSAPSARPTPLAPPNPALRPTPPTTTDAATGAVDIVTVAIGHDTDAIIGGRGGADIVTDPEGAVATVDVADADTADHGPGQRSGELFVDTFSHTDPDGKAKADSDDPASNSAGPPVTPPPAPVYSSPTTNKQEID